MSDDPALGTIWRRFRHAGDLRPGVCLVASASAALLLAGLGMIGGWLVGMSRPSIRPGLITGDVKERDIVVGVTVAAVVWFVTLLWLWRPAIRFRLSRIREARQTWTAPLLGMAAVAAFIVVLSYVVGRKPWDDRQWAVLGVSLIGGGVVVLLWLPAVFLLEQGRSVIGRTGEVYLRCPGCGYSMAGLRTSNCPECGAQYTLDELFQAQDYDTAPDSSPASAP